METLVSYFFTEYPNCELASFGIQWFNLISTGLFFIVAYYLIRNSKQWTSFLVFLAGLGSLIHHIWPIDETVALDMFPALIVGLIFLYFAIRKLSMNDWLLVLLIAVVTFFALIFDTTLCSIIPSGTHFIWHIGAALLIFIIGRKI